MLLTGEWDVDAEKVVQSLGAEGHACTGTWEAEAGKHLSFKSSILYNSESQAVRGLCIK